VVVVVAVVVDSKFFPSVVTTILAFFSGQRFTFSVHRAQQASRAPGVNPGVDRRTSIAVVKIFPSVIVVINIIVRYSVIVLAIGLLLTDELHNAC